MYMIFADCFILGMTIIILRFHNKPGHKEVPKFLLKICRLETDDSIHGNDALEAEEKVSLDGGKTSQLQDQNTEEWKAVARMADKYLCGLVAVVTVLILIVIGCIARIQ